MPQASGYHPTPVRFGPQAAVEALAGPLPPPDDARDGVGWDVSHPG